MTMMSSSFGPEWTSTGEDFPARNTVEGSRARELDRRQQYYDCTQHDHKIYDFDGRVIPRGAPTANPFISADAVPYWVPLRQRRPSSPYRVGRIIVNSFTNLLFGEQRFPDITAIGDAKTQDFAQALCRAAKLPVKMIRARRLGGSTGSVGLSWCYYQGYPYVNVHNAKNIHVHRWYNEDQWIPGHVTEIYRYKVYEWDGRKKGYVDNWYWYRRDWTEQADLCFHPVLFEPGKDPNWQVDKQRSVVHEDGICHFVWIQNTPSDEMDGEPDYHGLYEQMDTLDILFSAIAKGTVLNLDPTLILKMDPDEINRLGLKKGSDNAISVGLNGDASYMEMSGSGINVALEVFKQKRNILLEACQCVVPDPATVAANGSSSLTIKAIYAPMLAATDIFREQYGHGIVKLLDQMVYVARQRISCPVYVVDEETGQEEEYTQQVCLPPREEVVPILDPVTGEDTGQTESVYVDREPGQGGELDTQWGPYFSPTPTDQQTTVTTALTATGGKPVLSTETAVDIVAGVFSIDPTEEKRRVKLEAQQMKSQTEGYFADQDGSMGIEVEAPQAKEKGPADAQEGYP